MIKTSALIKQLNKSAKNLSIENKKIFDDIILYIRFSNIKTRDAEEFLQQILDSFLNAQKQGVSIEYMLGTPDIKHYCEEIVRAYKSSYNYLSLFSEYVMSTGIIIIMFSIINYIIQNFTIFWRHDIDKLTFYLNFDSGLIFQLLLIVPLFIAVYAYFRKSCFKVTTKRGQIKEFFILWVLAVLLICIMVAFLMFVGKIILFRLNIILVLIVGIALYFIGNYASER
ncbi:DUF1129 domain-containing protein [Clostridium estertheticum]|uniref:DUF1048 domain-containing protein n=1 Tax=Clostridium estertheticum TaxID=238834 RepID=A0A7Y3SSX0_9CLOT|nr:hypothetical protein [Clostridium estertheticum]MBW9173108.1 hypothetical protein [Clostridium estertheticum]MCB2340263.1 hypothetical protein [Clostridium estertheticum]NNU74343.1 hypothetical protein [Clostridium estertheticum]WBL45234.1 hypothetical protein LOR37_10990 [Clostridium estertheticum]WLC77243.1 hypothetical protein KTC99_10835 [Clostridium estertheticum]